MTGMNLRMPFKIKITTSDSDFQKGVLSAIRDVLNAKLQIVAREAEDKIKNNLKRVFITSDAYLSLVNGPLDAHFGIPQGEAISRMDSIIDAMASSLFIDVTKVSVRGGNLGGGLTVYAIPGDYLDLLKLPAGIVQTDKGENLPWLEWLLTKGDAIIISGYSISFGSFPNSRSGAALMVSNNTKGWRVPIGVSGTINDNWITRAINDAYSFIDDLISKAIEDSMNKVL